MAILTLLVLVTKRDHEKCVEELIPAALLGGRFCFVMMLVCCGECEG